MARTVTTTETDTVESKGNKTVVTRTRVTTTVEQIGDKTVTRIDTDTWRIAAG